MQNTGMKTNSQTDLIENQELRNQLIQKVEVLNKVKKLFLLPELNVMTVKQVAEYYEVDIDVIKKVYQRNKNEIDEDGTCIKFPKDFSKGNYVPLKREKGKIVYKIADNITFELPTRGIRCFSQRAILRISMLLRDSKVAKEVRTQLLNVFECSDDNQRLKDIEEETEITNSIGQAILNGDFEELKNACVKGFAFKNRHITTLEEKNEKLTLVNEALTQETNTWDCRAVINALLRKIGFNYYGGNMQYLFNTYYKALLYKYGINLRSRQKDKKSSLMSYIRESEWSKCLLVAVALCNHYDLDIADIIGKTNYKKVKEMIK